MDGSASTASTPAFTTEASKSRCSVSRARRILKSEMTPTSAARGWRTVISGDKVLGERMNLLAAARNRYRQWLIHFGKFLCAKHVDFWPFPGVVPLKEQGFKSSFSLRMFFTPATIGKWSDFWLKLHIALRCIKRRARARIKVNARPARTRDCLLGFICAE